MAKELGAVPDHLPIGGPHCVDDLLQVAGDADDDGTLAFIPRAGTLTKDKLELAIFCSSELRHGLRPQGSHLRPRRVLDPPIEDDVGEPHQLHLAHLHTIATEVDQPVRHNPQQEGAVHGQVLVHRVRQVERAGLPFPRLLEGCQLVLGLEQLVGQREISCVITRRGRILHQSLPLHQLVLAVADQVVARELAFAVDPALDPTQ
mmetsp:Transcript_63106/g.112591  ORF Transcript_63106/g.112591 Transcript_63106/m.112591 type:complete len:204 (+) Transcript_63106:617-1228(+)